MRGRGHYKGCHKDHEGCDIDDIWCSGCGLRFSPPDGESMTDYVCLSCRSKKKKAV